MDTIVGILRRVRICLLGYDFFISYSRGRTPSQPDDLPRGEAHKYAAALEAKLAEAGFTCFRDDTELAPGVPVKPAVGSAIDGSQAIVAIASKDADHFWRDGKQHPGWVATEVGLFLATRWTWRPVLLLLRLLSPFRTPRVSRVLVIAFGEMTDEGFVNPAFDAIRARLGLGNQLSVGVIDVLEHLRAGTTSPDVVSAIQRHADWVRVRTWATTLAWSTAALAAFLLGSWYLMQLGARAQRVIQQIESTDKDTPLIGPPYQADGCLYQAVLVSALRARLDDESLPARHRASHGALLFILNREDYVWPYLAYSADPKLRTLLFRRIASSGAQPSVIFSHLERLLTRSDLQDYGGLQALVLCVGRYDDADLAQPLLMAPETSLDAQLSAKAVARLAQAYAGGNDLMPHPDPGVHSAIAWVLRRWKGQDFVDRFDRRLAEGIRSEQRFFEAVEQGETDWGWFVTPAPLCRTMIVFRVEQRENPPRAYAISTTEETYGAFSRLGGEHTAYTRADAEGGRAVRGVSWAAATEYCKRLALQTGRAYRLPTEAEWARAAHVTSSGVLFFGDLPDVTTEFAWIAANGGIHEPLDTGNNPLPKEPAQLMPNASGLFDTVGNVEELCSPAHPERPPVLRGGNLLSTANVQVHRVFNIEPNERDRYFGFRVVIDVPASLKRVPSSAPRG